MLSLGRPRDYFSFLGIPRRIRVDEGELDRRYRLLSRQFHPDYFCNAPPSDQRASLERSSYLNDAYRTLKQPISRVAYLLELEGFRASASNGQGASPVPPALLEEAFALNEELDAVRELRAAGAAADVWRRRLAAAQRPIDARREEHEADLERLSAEWDAVADAPGRSTERARILASLRERVLERNYIVNLLAGIERELSGPAV